MQVDPLHPALSTPDVLLIEITRAMVKSGDRESIRAPLDRLVFSGQTVRSFAHRVRVLFTGYENDPRPLYQIAEVRAYVQALTDEFPYWLHFGDKDSGSLLVLLMCLSELGGSTQVGSIVRIEVDSDSFYDKVMELFGWTNGLFETHGLTAEENSASTRRVKAYLDARFARA